MTKIAGDYIADYLRQTEDVFSVDDFHLFLKQNGIKLSKSDAEDILRSSDFVFSLVDKKFVTRAGAFTGRWFSFKPTKEEVEKGYFLLGHRCMPFINMEVSPDSITVFAKSGLVKSKPVKFSMNVAMDVFALYGEGYVIPYILNDKGNDEISIASVQYSLPTDVKLTAWPLSKLCREDQTFSYGDRVLCRVIDWDACVVEMEVLPNLQKEFIVSEDTIEREEWYSIFEDGLLSSFDRHGPTTSIEEQLAFLFLENQEQLCTRSCGSAEEFLTHTNKIDFEPYGVETRIWKAGEMVPYIGKWNKNPEVDDLIMSEIAMTFTPQVVDAYLENYIYETEKGKNPGKLEDLVEKMFPQMIRMSSAERKLVLLNMDKRHDILKRNYNRFSDYSVAELRKRSLDLFTQVSTLLCSLGCSGISAEEFPQQELVIMTQLYSHVVRLLEEFENVFMRSQFPTDDVMLSLEGMEETFDEVSVILRNALESNRYKGYEIVK